MKLKEAELSDQQRRVDNFIEAISQGRDSNALGKALQAAESRVEALTEELEALRASRDRVFEAPPQDWISGRLSNLQEILETKTEKSALLLRACLDRSN